MLWHQQQLLPPPSSMTLVSSGLFLLHILILLLSGPNYCCAASFFPCLSVAPETLPLMLTGLAKWWACLGASWHWLHWAWEKVSVSFPQKPPVQPSPFPLLKFCHANPVYPWRWGSSGFALRMSPGKAGFISLHPTQQNCWLSTIHGDNIWQTLSSTQALSTLFLMMSFCFEQKGSVSGPCWLVCSPTPLTVPV